MLLFGEDGAWHYFERMPAYFLSAWGLWGVGVQLQLHGEILRAGFTLTARPRALEVVRACGGMQYEVLVGGLLPRSLLIAACLFCMACHYLNWSDLTLSVFACE